MEKSKILKAVGTFATGLFTGYLFCKGYEHLYTKNSPNDESSDVSCLYEPFDGKVVAGASVRDIINLLEKDTILVINKNSDLDKYAIIAKTSLFGEDDIARTEKGFWISNSVFKSSMQFDETEQCYRTYLTRKSARYVSNLSCLGTEEYVVSADRYKARLIKDSQDNILGVVFEIQ